MHSVHLLSSILLVGLLTSTAAAEDAPGVRVGPWLGKAVPGRGGRSPFAGDAALARIVAEGDLPTPVEGEDGWTRLAVDGSGVVAPGHATYACAIVESDEDRVVLLRGRGHAWASVNGAWVAGDVYGHGAVGAPVALVRGANRLVVRVGRGPFALSFAAPSPGVAVEAFDATLPDVRQGAPLEAWGSIVVQNPGDATLDGLVVTSGGEGSPFDVVTTPVASLPPLGLTRAPFRLRLARPVSEGDGVDLPVTVSAAGRSARVVLRLRVRGEGASWNETFRSRLDGSVQYFAVRAPRRLEPGRRYGLVLTLHGAGVQAGGQVDAYSAKEWCYVVAPTNRRPFGFDWEDWGRDDALEVLDEAQRRLAIDPLRVHLTGHSMGGHGTWHVAVTCPDRFAAAAPSAGWVSFFSYGGVAAAPNRDVRDELFARVLGPSDTLSLLENLRPLGLFVLHGRDDDNVPADESRRIVDALRRAAHDDLRYREEPDAGHWWDKQPAPGADCVDLAALFDLLARRARREAPRAVSFRTWNPGISARSAWVTLEGQERPLGLSSVEAAIEPDLRQVRLTTSNVNRVSLDVERFLEPGPVPVEVVIDGATVATTWSGGAALRLERDASGWRAADSALDPALKQPARYGPYKRAFDQRFVLVYGTGGTPDENLAALRRARFDAQTWGYRANGAADVVADAAFDVDGELERGVVLYGHRDMNSAFARVLPRDAVLSVERGRVRVGEKVYEGDDLACLAALPRRGAARAMVAIVGGTGPAGLRLSLATPYFSSGVAYPDLTVFDPRLLHGDGSGLRAAAILDARWALLPGSTWLGP
jgi:predicted esterase